jgi:hypothetical protein
MYIQCIGAVHIPVREHVFVHVNVSGYEHVHERGFRHGHGDA